MDQHKLDASEKFWIGDRDAWTMGDKVVNYMQHTDGKRCFASTDGLELDPAYSEYSVRLHNPGVKSLSFVLSTIAILPKSQLLTIYNLIGEYLNGNK